jgi:hypothetical protein
LAVATREITGETSLEIYSVPGGERLARLSPDSDSADQPVFAADGNRLLRRGPGGLKLYYRQRPEYWWGVAWLPEFWLTLVFGVGFVWSVWRDRRDLRPRS